MRRMAWVRYGILGTLMVSGGAAVAQESGQEQAALATALRTKHVALTTGLKAAATKGTPISAKYEYEDGKLQLSVYTEKNGQFSEVVVDHHTGKVAKTEKITKADDVTAAQTQSAAMAKGKTSLATAVARALAANKGYGAVSATAATKGGQSIAEIVLIKGKEFKSVTEPLA